MTQDSDFALKPRSPLLSNLAAPIKPSDIQKVASYVLSLQGSKPVNPKPTEPEAKKWVDENAPKDATQPAATDTTKVAAKEVATK